MVAQLAQVTMGGLQKQNPKYKTVPTPLVTTIK